MNVFKNKKTIGLAIFLAVFLVTHFALLFALPYIIEDKAVSLLQSKGLTPNSWFVAPRIEPDAQPVVRASPDLSYALCLIDLSDGPVQVSSPRSSNYGSLSVFDGNTDNAYVGSLMGTGTLSITVYTGSMATKQNSEPVKVRSSQVIAIIRRLAPTQEQFDESSSLAARSVCSSAKH